MLSISVDGTCPIHATTLPNNLSSPIDIVIISQYTPSIAV